MKKLLLFIIVLSSFCTLNSFARQYGWADISANIPGTPNFSDVFFVSDDEGWITSNYPSPMIFHTTDGGETFEIQSTEYGCNAIHMLSKNEGYAGGASGFIYRTTNGGANWNFHGTTVSNIADISFPLSGDTGYCCGINGNIHAITSSGVTKMTSNINGTLSSISFPVNSEEGWVCGGSVIRHFNNGIWNGDQDMPSGGYNAIFMMDSLNGWAGGDGGIIIHTTDDQNWFEQTNADSRSLYGVIFLNTNEGWAIGSSGRILHTDNGRTTWTVEADGLTSYSLTGVHFTSPTNGYVVGNGKTLLKYGTITSVENEGELPTQFSLLQNYPNPFNPSTTIKYSIPSSVMLNSFQHLSTDETPKQALPAGRQVRGDNMNVTLKIYDILGREVAILVNEIQQAGYYSVKFDAIELTSGIYFYTLKYGDYFATQKIILLR